MFFSSWGALSSQALGVVRVSRCHLNAFAHVHLTYGYDVSSTATHATHFSYLTLIHHVSTPPALPLGPSHVDGQYPQTQGTPWTTRSYLSAIICSPDGQWEADGRTRECLGRTSKGTGAPRVETNPTNLTVSYCNLINRRQSAAEAESANDRDPNRKDVHARFNCSCQPMSAL